MSTNSLPYLHHGARSLQIPSLEIEEVYVEEMTRSLPAGVNLDEYVERVLP